MTDWPDDCTQLRDIGLRDKMTYGAVGLDARWLIGRTVVAAQPVEDSDRSEYMLLCSDGFVMELSCDPGYADDDMSRTDDRWMVCCYDATDTLAGALMRKHFGVELAKEHHAR